MSDYRRLVSYIYSYPGGVREKNVGFVKAEVRNGQMKLSVTLKGVYTDVPQSFGIYLMVDKDDDVDGRFTLVKIGNIIVSRGTGQYTDLLNPQNINQSMYTFNDIEGIAIANPENDYYMMFSLWGDTEVNPAAISFAPDGYQKGQGMRQELMPGQEGPDMGEPDMGEPDMGEPDMDQPDLDQPEGQMPEDELPPDDRLPLEPGPVIVPGLDERSEQQRNEDQATADYKDWSMNDSDGRQDLTEGKESDINAPRRFSERPDRDPLMDSDRMTDENSDMDSRMDSDMMNDMDSRMDSDMMKDMDSRMNSDMMNNMDSRMDSDMMNNMDSRMDSEMRTEMDDEMDQNSDMMSQEAGKELGKKIPPYVNEEEDDRDLMDSLVDGDSELIGYASRNQKGNQKDQYDIGYSALDETLDDSERIFEQMDSSSGEKNTKMSESQMRKRYEALQYEDSPEMKDIVRAAGADQRNMRSNRMSQQNVRQNGQQQNRQQNMQQNMRQNVQQNGQQQNMQQNMQRPYGRMQGFRGQMNQTAQMNYNRNQRRGMTNAGNQPWASQPGMQNGRQNMSSNAGQGSGQLQAAEDTVQSQSDQRAKQQPPLNGFEAAFQNADFIDAFDDDYFYNCVEVTPDQLKAFPVEDESIINNSFLIHGYYNYKHILFGRVRENDNNTKYFLGVPGMYCNRERFMASMFGFNSFKKSHRSDYTNPYFGYWYQEL